MPIYEYRCENGHQFEVMQRITEGPVTQCQECQAAVQRVFHPVAVHFKGSGFYNTDYGTAKRKREQSASNNSESGKSSDSSSGESGSKDSGKSASSSGSDSASPSPAAKSDS